MTVQGQKMIKDLKFHIFILQTYNLYVAITKAHLISAIFMLQSQKRTSFSPSVCCNHKSAPHFRHLYVAITETRLISAMIYHCIGQHQVT